MGLMDRVKAQATVLAEKAQETARDSKAKFDQAQAKRRGDVLLRNLGALVYAEHTGRGTPGTQADIDRLVADIKAHEAENGISLAPESGDQPQSGPGAEGYPPPADPTGFTPPPDPAGFTPPPDSAGFPPPDPAGFPPPADPTGFPPPADSPGLPPEGETTTQV